MVVGEVKRSTNIMDGIENTGDVRLHDHRLRLKQRFDIVRKLGQGTYGKVQLGINKKTGQEVAIKTIKKCKIESEADLVRIRREVQIMSSVRHPNIVHIYEVFENSEKMILVMEYCSGGELYDYLSQKKVLQEDEARRLFRQIATAVYYCHIHKICHRDLKLENVLLDHTGSAKIADFGLSNVFKETSLLSTFCGSPLYASPEIVKGTPYIGPEVDCWSLGVLLYTLVYGAMPFDGSNFKRLVRQISNGDYYEPKNPSSASPLIRDMLTVDPLKRADIAYICDHSWVNTGCETSCLEVAEVLAAETPVRLDLLLSLAPAAPSNSNSVVVPSSEQAELGPEESCADLTSSASMAVEPSNSAEKRILELVAEGGEDAIKPSPTRTIVSASDNKRKLELAMSASGLQRKKERVASCASIAPQAPVPEEPPADTTPEEPDPEPTAQPGLKSSATVTIAPSPAPPTPAPAPAPAPPKELAKTRAASSPREKTVKDEATPPEKNEETKVEETKPSAVASAADKLTSLSLSQPTPANQTPAKPKKLSIPGGNVGNFKDQFERRASLTSPPEPKRTVPKPAVVSKIAKPKAQSEDRDLPAKAADAGTVRLQQIGIEPTPQAPTEEPSRGGVKKTESEPSHGTPAVDTSVLLQDARRSLQNSMAKLVEEKAGEESRRRAARDIISSAIRTGKPPVPYGRSSSAGVASLVSPPGTPPAPQHAPTPPRLYRTEAQHRVEDHRNRGVSVERIIPIHVAEESPTSPPPLPQSQPPQLPKPAPPQQAPRPSQTPLRRLVSSESSASEACSSPGEPIKKSAREFIIPIAVEGKGYVTPRQRSLEPEAACTASRVPRTPKPRRISSLVSGGESEEEDDTHMHRLRSSRAARAESVSSGEEDEEDEGFHLLTAENLFSTLLHRVRALTNRLNGEEGPGFPHHPHSLFNNLQSPFFNSPHLPRRHLLREGWGARDLHANFESMFNKPRAAPRGSSKKTKQTGARPADGDADAEAALDLSDLDLSAIQFSEREMRALSGLTPALSRRLQRQLLAHLPPRAASRLRRTLSLREGGPPHADAPHAAPADAPGDPPADADPAPRAQRPPPPPAERSVSLDLDTDSSLAQFCTLPRLRRRDRSPPPDALSPPPPPEPRARPLLSKYLTPERALSPEDAPRSPDGPEPTRRHSLRLAGEPGRRRVSRFLRSDFFDSPPDESALARRRREKELETQRILREIREKRTRSLEAAGGAGPADADDAGRKCLSPGAAPAGRDRSRSTTPFLPILDELREAEAAASARDSRLVRPRSYPVKELDAADEAQRAPDAGREGESRDRVSLRESKLVRPRSYPTSSPSPEKVYVSRDLGERDEPRAAPREVVPEVGGDVEVSFSITLPRKTRPDRPDPLKPAKSPPKNVEPPKVDGDKNPPDSLIIRKYRVIGGPDRSEKRSSTDRSEIKSGSDKSEQKSNPVKSEQKSSTDKSEQKSSTDKSEQKISNDKTEQKSITHKSDRKVENGIVSNGGSKDIIDKANSISDETKVKVTTASSKKDESKPKVDGENGEKKGTIKKKIIRKVSSKSKTDLGNSQEVGEGKTAAEKKKVTKKVKEKTTDDGTKSTTVTKKKSVLQSIGHKLEKFASNKSSSPEKGTDGATATNKSNDVTKSSRIQREQSVPVSVEPPTESNLIKRAVTLTDVAALETQNTNNTKTTVSKVLGLFKKFEPKEKPSKPSVEKSPSENLEGSLLSNSKPDIVAELISESPERDKPRRPTSLLLNGLSRKNKYGTVSTEGDDQSVLKKENEPKNLRNTLKLDFSRLPRVKKIVPTNPVIEPQVMNVSSEDKDAERKTAPERNGAISDGISNIENEDTQSRSRSRSRSTVSNSELKSDLSADGKISDKHSGSPSGTTAHHPLRNRESTSPDKDDIVDRIRRKSFYSRFNEKKQRRKSSLVGPGAADYDPLARIHSPPADPKRAVSPVSPGVYDVSPGYSVASDLSPSTERYRTLLTDLSLSSRNNIRYDNHGLNDKIDTYRSLDRNDFRKYPSGRSYLDYDQPTSYSTHRYSRTKSLLDDGVEEPSLGQLRDPKVYNRTLSMYSPGNYATYRPKRTRNSAIILKDSEKEPSPENILEKIRQRKKISISVTRKPDPEKDPPPRSTVSPKGEGDSAERPAQAD